MSCTGIIYRFRTSVFLNKKSEIVESKRLTKLKRESCKGNCRPSPYLCDCVYMPEHLEEALSDGYLQIPSGALDGDKFRLKIKWFGDEVDDIYLEEVEQEMRP